MVLLHGGGDPIEVKAGETVFIAKGERFRPTFPEGGTEYVPVCLPAFRPDRCLREDGDDSLVSKRLKTLHTPASGSCAVVDGGSAAAPPEVLYHMCVAARWEAAKAVGGAYFPPTFDADGLLTHATGVPSRLLTTANHFYTSVEGEWVCLRFTRAALRRHGVVVRDEAAAPVGDTPAASDWAEWVCPHILGGIPVGVVDAEFPMERDEKGRFVRIRALCDA